MCIFTLCKLNDKVGFKKFSASYHGLHFIVSDFIFCTISSKHKKYQLCLTYDVKYCQCTGE